MNSLNPYEPPSSIVMATSNEDEASFRVKVLISIFSSFLAWFIFWVPIKLLRMIGWPDRPLLDPIGYFDTMGLFSGAMSDFVFDYFLFVIPVLILFSFSARYIQSREKRRIILLIFLALFAMSFLAAISAPKNFIIILISLPFCLYCLILGPSVVFSWWLFNRGSAFVKNNNDLGMAALLVIIGLLTTGISFRVLWRPHV